MNNIMWFKRGDEIVGVLCDWDLAEDHSNGDRQAVKVDQSEVAVPDKGKGKAVPPRRSQRLASKRSNQQNGGETAATSEVQVKPRHRTGTGPFMAVDLLVLNPPPLHKYRHDLESFFYIYICSAATYDPDSEQRISVIEAWNSDDLKSIGLSKGRFLMDLMEYRSLFQHSHPEFQPMIDGALYKLYKMFHNVEFEGAFARSRMINDDEEEDSGAVQALLDDTEKRRDEHANYEEFMRLIGASPE